MADHDWRYRLNPAAPAPGTPLCRVDEIAEPGGKGFYFREGDALFAGFVIRKDGEVRGYVDSCPHAGWPLGAFGDRYLTRDQLILCTGHGALFRPLDGVCVAGPCLGQSLTPWPITITDGEIAVA